MADKDIELNEVCQSLAKSLKMKLDEYAESLRQLREQELKKSAELAKVSPPGKFKDLPEKLKDQGHSAESAFKIAWSAKNKDDKAKKSELAKEEWIDKKLAEEKKLKKQGSMGGMTAVPGTSGSGVASPMAMKEKLGKEMLCKKCGKSHDMGKCAMDEAKVVKKDEMLPQTGSKPDRAAEGSVLPGDKKSKKVKAEGSGGLKKVSIPEVNQELSGFKSLAAGKKQLKLPGVTKPRPKGLAGIGHDIEGSMVGGKMPAVGAKTSAGAKALKPGEFKATPPGAGTPNPADVKAKKSEPAKNDLKKSMGNCAMCKATEHTGNCKQ